MVDTAALYSIQEIVMSTAPSAAFFEAEKMCSLTGRLEADQAWLTAEG